MFGGLPGGGIVDKLFEQGIQVFFVLYCHLGFRGSVLGVVLDVVDRFGCFLVVRTLELGLFLPKEVPALDDGGGVELAVRRTAVDPVLDVAVLALALVAIGQALVEAVDWPVAAENRWRGEGSWW